MNQAIKYHTASYLTIRALFIYWKWNFKNNEYPITIYAS